MVQYEKKKKKKKRVVEDKIYGFSLYASWTHVFGEVAQRRKLGGSKFSRVNIGFLFTLEFKIQIQKSNSL